jgi:hypothetical protein
MRKSLLALSVSAALAPSLGFAQAAAPAAPTLDKVLEASGLSITGYIDTAYSHADRDIERGFSTRVFDSQNNSFMLHQMGLQIAKQPKEGFGGLVNVTAGRDAGVMHSSDANENTFDLTQAYGQYASGALTVIAGKFTTLHGTEVLWSPSNANFSRSILFGSVPFTHTGVRATFAANDMFSLIGGVNNGWDQLKDQNKGKTIELGGTAMPLKTVSLAASYYGGQETGALSGMTDRRDSFNAVGTWNVIDPLSLGLEYLSVQQKNAILDAGGAPAKGKYSGLAAYASYTFMPKLKGTLRVESFDDKDGLRYGLPAGTTSGSKYKEFTLTMSYLAADNFELRGEVRQDRASQAVFTDDTAFSKTLTTYAVQALYKF